jgi:CzcA family heavy metal efflux pump
MLRSIITFCLRFRLVVLLLAGILVVGGGVAIQQAPWDVFPEFAPPQIIIQTESSGLSTEEVERLVTVPVESALGGMTRLETLRSSSISGLSVVTAIFEEGTNILSARQFVKERLDEIAPLLPQGVEPPRMVPLTASTSRLLLVGLTSTKTSLQDLRTLAEWTLGKRLRAVRGVAHVEFFGGEIKQYQVLVRPDRMRFYNVTLDEVTAAAKQATGFGGAGFIETSNQRLPIRQWTRIESTADLGAAPVAVQDGVPITLADVAEVKIAAADKVGEAAVNGRPGVLLSIHKQPYSDTLAVTRDVQAALEEMRSSLPQDVEMNAAMFRQANFIERALGNLNVAIAIGCLLAIAVLIAFLYQWRTAAISLSAIPLSLLGAILVLRAFGASLNTMTLGGLAISIGVVVDDAIVDVENVVRRLRENRHLPRPRSTMSVILDACMEVRSAVVYASFIVILVILPVLFLPGLGGTFFRPLGYAYIIAILISLLVAVTVTPALCLLMLRKSVGRTPPSGQVTAGSRPSLSDSDREPPLVRFLKYIYGKVLNTVLDHPWITLASAACLLVASLAVIPFLGGELLPDFRESNVNICMFGKPDSSMDESVRMGGYLAKELLAIDGVRSVAQQIGRADLSEDTWGPDVSEVLVVVDERADYDNVLRQFRETLDHTPGYVFEIKQFLRERMDEVLTGVRAQLAIRVVGPDLQTLRQKADEIKDLVQPIAGVVDLRVEQQVEVPGIEVMVDPQKAARYGFSAGELHEELQSLLRGVRVGQVYEEDAVFDLVLRGHPEVRSAPASLLPLLLDSPTGEKIPLKAVARVNIADAPNIINREGGSRRMLVTCNVRGRDVAGAMQEIQQQVQARLKLPPSGYHVEFSGEHQARNEALNRLVLLSAAALVGIFVLLYLDFQSVRLTAMVMLSVPLACVGGVTAMLIAGGNVSLGSMVGFVTVFGVAVRNGILLVSHYQHLGSTELSSFISGGTPSQGVETGVVSGGLSQFSFDENGTVPLTSLAISRELLVRGALERLSPILMTASTAALSLLPLVVLGDRPGYEIEHPMAVVIVGGLISSTLLTLVVLPVLYQWFGRAGRDRRSGGLSR